MLKAGWFGKVGFRRVAGKILGRFGGLRSWEFWEGCCWVAAEDFGWLGVVSGMVSVVEGRAVLLEGRVRLGGELGVICWAVKASGSVG